MKMMSWRLMRAVLVLGLGTVVSSCMWEHVTVCYKHSRALKLNESVPSGYTGGRFRVTLLEIDEAGKRCLFRVEDRYIDAERTCWVNVGDEILIGPEDESGYILESIDRESVILISFGSVPP